MISLKSIIVQSVRDTSRQDDNETVENETPVDNHEIVFILYVKFN